jgi:arsenate reductase
MSKIKVLFLCTGNTARSQMAEAFLREYAGDRFDAYSAGLQPGEINPFTRAVMEEIGLDLAGQYSKDVLEYMGKVHFGYLITVCRHAEENCPSTFPGVSHRLHWDLEDPAAFEGSEEETRQKFREIRDRVSERIKAWIRETTPAKTSQDRGQLANKGEAVEQRT